MRLIILRCEDAAKGAPDTGLLDGAKMPHLQQLAQAGAGGRVQPKGRRPLVDRLALHRALLGAADQSGGEPGRWYAAASGVPEVPADRTAWCCELMTQRDGVVADAAAGHIPTKESQALIQALNDALGSETQRWVLGNGPHHVLLAGQEALPVPKGALALPEAMIGEAWTRHLPKAAPGKALQALIQRAAVVLESHPVNRVRVDLGENPANLIWLWGQARGAAHAAPGKPAAGLLVSSHFPMQGAASSLGFEWQQGPASLQEAPLQRLMKSLAAALPRYERVYVHLRVESGVPVERQCAMERIDQHLLKPLTERLSAQGSWRMLAVVDDRVTQTVPFVAIGGGLPSQPVVHLHGQAFAESPLQFDEPAALSRWATAGAAA